MPQTESDKALTKPDDLLEIFETSCKPRAQWRVGMESEKFGFGPDCKPLAFEGEQSISAVLSALCERYGWKPYRETPGGPPIALRRDNAEISLEPGNQFELSGAPFHSVHELAAEVAQHRAELESVSKPLGLRWYSMGHHPFATRAEINTNPKIRYDIMRNYLPTRGSRGLDMMLRTCTVQANYDFGSISDALRKMLVALKFQPITTAIFANSPMLEGKDSGAASQRAMVWLDTDRDRSGLLPFLWSSTARIEDYVAWALQVPMFFIKRDGETLRNTGQTFAAFMQDGFQGQRATAADWELHLSTLFPEVRLKRTIEVRGADAPPWPYYLALPALWKGIFYDERALDAALALGESLDHAAVAQARLPIATHALRATLGGQSVQSWAERLLEIAHAGLQRIGVHDAQGQDESIHLASLIALVGSGRCPADVFRDQLGPLGQLEFDSPALELNRFC